LDFSYFNAKAEHLLYFLKKKEEIGKFIYLLSAL